MDFRLAEHLPKLRGGKGHADPGELPRQRRGVTPQMHGRYPDFDVLEQARHWDEATRKVVLERVENVPEIRFFDQHEAETARVFCDDLTAQDADPRIPVVNFVDQKLANGELDGYQYWDMPDDREAWRLVLRGLDEQARQRGAPAYAEAGETLRHEIVHAFSEARLHGGSFAQLNVKHAFALVSRHAFDAFYAHPWAWNEIGWGGPAYPRGYARFGSAQLDPQEREEWEGAEASERDPIEDFPPGG